MHTLRRKMFLVVRVHAGPARPYLVKRDGAERGRYVRVGSTNRRADDARRAELGRYARPESFDGRPLPNLNSEAIDFRVASESFAFSRRLKRANLESLRCVLRYERRIVLSLGGVTRSTDKMQLGGRVVPQGTIRGRSSASLSRSSATIVASPRARYAR